MINLLLTPPTSFQRIGLFGGSFDPPHWGHLRTAQSAADELELDQLAFLPALRPPHKSYQPLTSFDLRRQMLERCLSWDARFRLCLVEADARLSGTTLTTIRRLRDQGFSEDRCHLIFLLGSDALLDLPQWYQPEALLEAVDLAVLPRPGFPSEKAQKRFFNRVKILKTPLVDLAAHDVRSHRVPLDEAAPPTVAQFIREKRLYNYR